MSPGASDLWSRLGAARRRLRRHGAFAALALAGSTLAAALVGSWILVGESGWSTPSAGPLALVVASLAAAALSGWLGWKRWVAAVDESSVAAAAEESRRMPPGSVRGILELRRGLPAGASAALFERAELELDAAIGSASERELSGELGLAAGRRRRGALAAVAGSTIALLLLGFSAPERARAAWQPLLHPVSRLTPPELPPLSLEPGDVRLRRGDTLAVRIAAPGRAGVSLHWRAAGEVPRQSSVEVSDGHAGYALGPIEAERRYWVAAPDGAVSDTFTATPIDPLMLSSLSVEIVFPSYLERESESWTGEVPPLQLPEGSELRIRGRATLSLDRVELRRSDGEAVSLPVSGATFAGRWSPEQSGTYLWHLQDDEGAAASPAPPPLELAVVRDGAPRVEIRDPGRDVDLGPDMRQGLVVDASDDHGVAGAALVSRRVDVTGRADEQIRTTIPVEGSPDRVLLRPIVDANDRRLLPGDVLEYHVEVFDNSPRRQRARTRTYTLRFPTTAELRAWLSEESDRVVEEASSASRSARELEASARDLRRRIAAGEAARGSSGSAGSAEERAGRAGSLDFDRAEEVRRLLEGQEELGRRAEELSERLSELERRSESAGMPDPELSRRMRELRDLLDEVITPQLRERLAELAEALEELDAARTERALDDLAVEQQRLRQAMDQSLDLLRRAAAEQRMQALAREARELATRQEALSESMDGARTPSPGDEPGEAGANGALDGPEAGGDTEPLEDQAAASGAATGTADEDRQRALAAEAESLEHALEALTERLREIGEPRAAEQGESAAGEASRATEAMEEAFDQARSGAPREAAESGREAARMLEQAAETLDSGRRSMTESWRQDVNDALQQATQEALSLAERESSLLQQMQQEQQRRQGSSPSEEEMGSIRSEQAAVKQGLEALGDNVSEAAGRSAMVDRQVGSALGQAMLRVEEALEATRSPDGRPRMPIRETEAAVQSLNQLALSLMMNSQRIASSESGTGLQEALEELARAAAGQGQLNGQASGLASMDLPGEALSRQLQRLSRAQRDIARQLEGLGDLGGGQEHVLGQVGELAGEAELIAQELAGGRLTPEVRARQERLFHRLLDAGRSLERDEYTDERRGERATAGAAEGAGTLDPVLLQAGPRFLPPDAAELRHVSPAYRRLILDYFERLNREAEAAER